MYKALNFYIHIERTILLTAIYSKEIALNMCKDYLLTVYYGEML